MRQLVLAAALIALPVHAILEVGDDVPNLCWKDSAARSLCLTQFQKKVRVLIYAAGWCPFCNDEIPDLVSRLDAYDGKPVVFINLMTEGFKLSRRADAAFLKQWKAKYRIPFPVVASLHNPGRQFFEDPITIPNAVIIGRGGQVLYKSMEDDLDELLEQVDAAIQSGK